MEPSAAALPANRSLYFFGVWRGKTHHALPFCLLYGEVEAPVPPLVLPADFSPLVMHTARITRTTSSASPFHLSF
jgi:hypothetical protein